jgi:hypothetical protein
MIKCVIVYNNGDLVKINLSNEEELKVWLEYNQ